jgi:hypothetical protein
MTVSRGGKPLEIGPHRITELRFDRTLTDYEDPDRLPTQVTLIREEQEPVELKVTKTAFGQDPGPIVKVEMVNGKTVVVDEVTLYLKAEG